MASASGTHTDDSEKGGTCVMASVSNATSVYDAHRDESMMMMIYNYVDADM